MTPPLSPQLFSLLTALVEDRIGLHYNVDDLPIFSDKVWSRMQEAGFDSALDYYYFLRYDANGPAEIANLIDALVVGETYLFREISALTAALETVIRPAVERLPKSSKQRVRIWSAGCSTGEEPYTLAILLAEAGLLDRVEIIATDVSKRSLRRATEGALSPRSLRAVLGTTQPAPSPRFAALADRFITDLHGSSPHMSRAIISSIDFRRDSLLASSPSLTDFELILCRNVLIYFRDDVVRQVVEMLASRLRVGGRIVVGASESLLRFGTLLRCEERAGAFFYAKENESS